VYIEWGNCILVGCHPLPHEIPGSNLSLETMLKHSANNPGVDIEIQMS